MKKFILPFMCCASALAQINSLPATPENVEKFEQIIDVRTPKEWRETGIIKGAKTIQLIQDRDRFLEQIKSQIDITKPFAIVCRSGNRSSFAAHLIDHHDFNITNLDGGMNSLIKAGYETIPYKD